MMECFAKIVNGYNNLCKLELLLRYKVFKSSILWNEYHDFFNTGLIFTVEVFILFRKSILCIKKWRKPKAEGCEFWYTLIFIEEHMLHNFTKYFSGAWVNQIVNKGLVNHLVIAICHLQLCKKWCLQNLYTIKKWMMLEIIDKNSFKIMTLPNNLVHFCRF